MFTKEIICDKNTCGLGKYVGRAYVCPHRNFSVLHPELCKEWDFEKNLKLPEMYSPNSNSKVSWVCNKNPCGCHKWEAQINNRTSKNNPTGCPYCSNRKLCEHNNLLILYPELCKEWDYEKNLLGPENYAPFTHHKIFWVCKNNICGCHKWESSIANRTGITSRNCPYCSNQKLCEHNNLTITHPELCKEWDYEKNIDSPNLYTYGSNKKVWWICPINPCGCHRYESAINKRSGNNPTNCPFCALNTKKLCEHKNLTITHPQLCKEWNYERNINDPSKYSAGSERKVWWICEKNHEWESVVFSRTRKINPTGCPSCCLSKQYSNAQIEWLESIIKEENIKIQHALHPDGEYKIKGIGKVDGYCHETNTVYEYHGSFFHGNPNYYNQEDINPISNKSYGDLYRKTLEKEKKIRDYGYNLIVKWDKEPPLASKNNLFII